MRPEAGSPADWMRFAYSDLDYAQACASPRVLLEARCFHLQQAAERSLKAVLLKRSIEVPRTHNLRLLLELLPSTTEVPEQVEQASRLSKYAVETRYPESELPVTDEEYHEALRLAQAVVDWAAEIVGA
jgi:HEPN domain-containing protein